MANMIRTPSSPGIKIPNGIIEEYYANTEEITPGTFVEFVNLKCTSKVTTSLDAIKLSACKVSDDIAILAYQASSDSNHYAVAVKIQNTQFQIGTPVTIGTAYKAFTNTKRLKIVKLSNNTAYVNFYNVTGSSSSNWGFTGKILSVNDTVITVITPSGQHTYLQSKTDYSSTDFCTVSDNIIMISRSVDSSSSFHNYICATEYLPDSQKFRSGTTVDTSAAYDPSTKKCYKIKENVMAEIGYYNSSSSKVYRYIGTVSKLTDITNLEVTVLKGNIEYCYSSGVSSITITCIFLASIEEFAVVYCRVGETLTIKVIRIVESTTETTVTVFDIANDNFNIVPDNTYHGGKVSSNKFYVLYRSNGVTRKRIIKITDTVLTVESDEEFCTETDILTIDDNFFAGLNYIGITERSIATAQDRIDGIVKSKATTTSKGKVFVLGGN